MTSDPRVTSRDPQKDEPPEITYCVSKTGDALNLQMLTPTQPMPRAEEVESKFLEVLVSRSDCSSKAECM